jgi:acetylornithine deacetylase/succinyl-diaminopimelate desuccinylase family protein
MNRDYASVFREEEVIEITCRLIRAAGENPPGGEEAAARVICDVLASHGIRADLSWAAPGRPNVVAVLEGASDGPVMVYNGHTDVVPAGGNWTKDPFAAVIENGRLYGRGASDMKAGVAAMMYAAIVLKRMGNPFAGKLVLFFNVDEERSNIGMHHMMKNPLRADYVVISEPSDLDVCYCHKGAGRYRIETAGVAGHTAVVEHPDNAVYKMVKIVAALEKLGETVRQRRHEALGTASLTVAQISGGTAPNIVPDRCVIEVDRRVLPGETEEQALAEIDGAAREAAEQGGFAYKLDPYLFVPPHEIAKDHPLTVTTHRIAERVTGRPRKIKAFTATTEAPFFSHKLGIPTLILGPGSLSEAHTADESVDVREIVDAARIFVELACEMLPLKER